MIHTLAAAADPNSTPWDYVSQFANLGVVGIILILILKRVVIPSWVHDEALKQRDAAYADMAKQRDIELARLQEDIDQLKKAASDSALVYTSQVIPTLTRVVDVLREDGRRVP